MKYKTLIIIPAYNEEDCIAQTIESIKRTVPEFDYVIINDCSTDATASICEERHFNMISLPINLGIGGALQTGYKYAKHEGYDAAVQVDGDGQHDPAFLNEMLQKLQADKADMIIGSRFIKKQGFQSSMTRRVGIMYFTGLIKLLTGFTITDPTSGLRMVNRELIQQFAKEYPNDYPEPESVVAVLKKKKKVREIPVIMKERQGGISSISPLKSIYYMIKVTLAIIIERIRK